MKITMGYSEKNNYGNIFSYFKMEDLDKLSIIHISGTKGKVSDRFGFAILDGLEVYNWGNSINGTEELSCLCKKYSLFVNVFLRTTGSPAKLTPPSSIVSYTLFQSSFVIVFFLLMAKDSSWKSSCVIQSKDKSRGHQSKSLKKGNLE